ncbi:MAG: aldolase/citrate lyase family protein [Gemmatimonadaceae bacterium]
MRIRLLLTAVGLASVAAPGNAQTQRRLNPIIELLDQKQPVFGLYAPANRRARPGESAPATAEAPKTQAQLAIDALGNKTADYVFDGSMEGNYDAAFPAFTEFVKGMREAGALQKSPFLRLHHPLMVKTPEISPDVGKATDRIGRQLNLGVSGIVFVSVESAEEVRAGIAAMRFKSKGGTRSDDVGDAPAFWGMSESAYKEKADLWPLNPNGELVNFTIVEGKAGLANVREIAAVKGIGVLFPGAGTLRGVFSTTDANGQRVLDEKAWEGAIQQVLAACKEFNVPCGYPANDNDIEMRMKQGFSVFVIGWGERGFKAVDVGRKVAGRSG